jgi:hypothetical protein
MKFYSKYSFSTIINKLFNKSPEISKAVPLSFTDEEILEIKKLLTAKDFLEAMTKLSRQNTNPTGKIS